MWDLDTVSARLQTTFGYRITQGTISALRLEIPPGLDVARIELKSAESTSSPTPISLLRNWRIARTPNSPATLLIELQGPTTGELRLQLELVQTGLLSSQPELRFPTPLDATEFDAHFAIRVAEVTLNGLPEKRGVNDSFADVFFRDLWQPIQLTKAGSQPQKSYTLIRGETPVLRPTLQLTSPVVNGTQELRWWITAPPHVQSSDKEANCKSASNVAILGAALELTSALL